MEVLNPSIVIRKRKGMFSAWYKKPYVISIEAGVETESETTRYAHTCSFGGMYFSDVAEIPEAVKKLRQRIQWDREMMVIDASMEFRDLIDLENI